MADEIRCAIELCAASTGPGRLVGTLLTYGERASDRDLIFDADSLTWPDGGIVINRQHTRSAPILRALPLVQGQTLVIDAALPDSIAGRDAAEEIRAGLLTGLSVEVPEPVTSHYAGRIRHVTSAAMRSAGLVDDPAFTGSRDVVLAQRGTRRRVFVL